MQELTFKEILKTLIPKTKILIVILLIGAVLGGCVGVASSYAEQFYGTEIVFYVSPKPGADSGKNDSQYGVYGAYGWHVMDNITKLLSSESFAEELLLGENGLPIESILEKETDRTQLDEKIAKAMGPISDAEAAKKLVDEADEVLSQKKLEYANASSEAAKANSNYLSLVSAKADAELIEAARLVSEDTASKEQQKKHELDAAEQDRQLKYNDYQVKHNNSLSQIEDVLGIWRTSEVYREYVELISRSVKYSFYDDTDLKVGTSTETLAKSFIYVNINVSESVELADFVYDRVTEVLPRYVRENMAVPSGYAGTNCQRISRLDEIKQAETGALLVTAIGWAVASGILAFIIVAVAMVVSSRTKEWVALNKKELTAAKDE